MYLLTVTAIFVGFLHSVVPSHWLPVALVSRARGWSRVKVLIGAVVASSGHLLLSALVAYAVTAFGKRYLLELGETAESWAGPALIVFGLAYALYSFLRGAHRHKGLRKVGRDADGRHHPFLLLFILGLTPCVAIIPVYAAAVPMGTAAVLLAVAGYSVGVVAALAGISLAVSAGLMRLKHPRLDRYADVLVGAGVALGGAALMLIHLPHPHAH